MSSPITKILIIIIIIIIGKVFKKIILMDQCTLIEKSIYLVQSLQSVVRNIL